MRRAIITVLALAGCSQGVRQIGPHQYTVTAPPDQVFAKAKETCAKLGRPVSSEGIPLADNIQGARYWHVSVECFLPYEIVSVDKDSYKIWAPASELRPADRGGNPNAPEQLEQRASDYCKQVNKAMVVKAGFSDLGYGIDLTFRCVASQ